MTVYDVLMASAGVLFLRLDWICVALLFYLFWWAKHMGQTCNLTRTKVNGFCVCVCVCSAVLHTLTRAHRHLLLPASQIWRVSVMNKRLVLSCMSSSSLQFFHQLQLWPCDWKVCCGGVCVCWVCMCDDQRGQWEVVLACCPMVHNNLVPCSIESKGETF